MPIRPEPDFARAATAAGRAEEAATVNVALALGERNVRFLHSIKAGDHGAPPQQQVPGLPQTDAPNAWFVGAYTISARNHPATTSAQDPRTS